jgi:hypothetical protein
MNYDQVQLYRIATAAELKELRLMGYRPTRGWIYRGAALPVLVIDKHPVCADHHCKQPLVHLNSVDFYCPVCAHRAPFDFFK